MFGHLSVFLRQWVRLVAFLGIAVCASTVFASQPATATLVKDHSGNIGGGIVSLSQDLVSTHHLFYEATRDENSPQNVTVWMTDGTPTGTRILETGLGDEIFPHEVNNHIMVICNSTSCTSHGLYRTDGTIAGTVRIKEGDFLFLGLLPDSTGLYALRKDDSSYEIWRSNGTVEGTQKDAIKK